jgi:ribonucleoside-diphosphate reductase alpha chain
MSSPGTIMEQEMRVTKRSGELMTVEFDKILRRLKILGNEAGIKINYTALAMKVIDQLFDGISTTKIDELSAEQCASMCSTHYDYNTLAGRIVISNHHKNTVPSFCEVMTSLYNFIDKRGVRSPLVSDELYQIVCDDIDGDLDTLCDFSRDYLIDYFGFKTLERAYLMKVDDKAIERPQHMWLRVAIGIHGSDMVSVKETYEYMSQKYFTHATPTLFNAGTPHPQLSSCFLQAMESDSIDGIYNTLKECALISKWAGGIGMHIHNVRASGSHIRGTNGKSNGIVPMLKVFNNTAKYVDQGGGRRNGSFAIYLEPWHADVEMFLQMRKNHGDEELKARDLFYAMWIPDLFMERIKENGKWTLMCPDECPGLADVYGDEFVELYTSYETGGKGRITINARDLWFQILDAQMETGTPYILFKDACNKKSNQKNLGTIKSSNLCVAPETLILTDKGHIEIKELEGQNVNVWNGEEYSEVVVVKTGIDQDMIEIFTDDGSNLTCTPYHKFYIQENYSEKYIKMVEAQHLKPDDKLIKCDYPVIDGPETFLHAYTHGFFCGDGTYGDITNMEERPCKFIALKDHYFCKRHLDLETAEFLDKNQNTDNKCKAMSYSKKPIIYLYGEKTQLKPHMEYRSFTENGGRIALQLPLDMPEKFSVPSFNCSINEKLLWFAGYCDADGSISLNGENEQLQVSSINYEFLQHVRLLLQTCGINPKIKQMRGKGQSYLPDGNGGNKYYESQAIYRLLISSCELYKLSELGFPTKRLKITGNKPAMAAKKFIKILKIENNNRCDDTYCFTEPKRHMGVFNGILTGQCTEIVEYSDDNETAVCNLASIALPPFVDANGVMNYEELHKVAKIVTNNLNRVIDVNYYPTPKTQRSNFKNRPVGIGIQGLSDIFMMMGIPFHSDEAKLINKHIFETIYHAALEKSCELAYDYGPYETFIGSPASKGILQFDMWNVDPTNERYDWTGLKNKIMIHGLRNSLLLAPMPTASTSQILGYNECIEPITSNIYSRRTMAGEFIITNKYLMRDLMKIDLWNEKIKNNIIANNGSVQHIEAIPQEIRDKYKTVWELPMKHLIDMSADRGAYICQSQSLNLWLEDPSYNTLTSMHFYSWSKGLKTGIYYLRRRARHQAQKFTIEPERKQSGGADCEMCGA